MQDVVSEEAPPPGDVQRVPWTLGDVGRALIVPGIFFGLNVLGGTLLDAHSSSLSEGELISTLAISMGFQIFLLGLVWTFSVRKYKVSWSELGLRKPVRGGWFFSFVLVMCAFAIALPYSALLRLLGVESEASVPSEAFDHTLSVILLGVLILGFAPIVEELFFRGFIFGGVRGRYNLPLALAIAGIIFGLAHAGTPESFLNVPVIAAIGALFAWSYVYTGSLFAGMGAHFLFNLAAFVFEVSRTS
jgi:membrane protease YdiL (CAAX protease family)